MVTGVEDKSAESLAIFKEMGEWSFIEGYVRIATAEN